MSLIPMTCCPTFFTMLINLRDETDVELKLRKLTLICHSLRTHRFVRIKKFVLRATFW